MPSDEREFRATAESVTAARDFVRHRLADWAVEDGDGLVALVVTELATNSVVHAGTVFSVRVEVAPSRVRVEVADGAPGSPTRAVEDPLATGGRGLLLVEALATSWGTERRGRGKLVWCELPCPVVLGPSPESPQEPGRAGGVTGGQAGES